MPQGSINILSWWLTDDGASGIVPKVPDDQLHPQSFQARAARDNPHIDRADTATTVAIMGVGKEKAPQGSLSFREDQ
jgi:hypothetical protein